MNNVIAFHGVDHKVGTTMLAQSVAEMIAKERRQLKIMLISLNGRRSTEYVGEDTESIENFKMQIDNKMIDIDQLLRLCLWKTNLYLLSGIGSSMENRYYHPETAHYLLRQLQEKLDLIIVDSGNEIDHGLAIGSLNVSDFKILVLTQQETMINRFETLRPLYNSLELGFKRIVINKFSPQDPYSITYILKRTGIESDTVRTVGYTDHYRQAEMNYQSLIAYEDDRYHEDVRKLSNDILHHMGIPQLQKKRAKLWKSFI